MSNTNFLFGNSKQEIIITCSPGGKLEHFLEHLEVDLRSVVLSDTRLKELGLLPRIEIIPPQRINMFSLTTVQEQKHAERMNKEIVYVTKTNSLYSKCLSTANVILKNAWSDNPLLRDATKSDGTMLVPNVYNIGLKDLITVALKEFLIISNLDKANIKSQLLQIFMSDSSSNVQFSGQVSACLNEKTKLMELHNGLSDDDKCLIITDTILTHELIFPIKQHMDIVDAHPTMSTLLQYIFKQCAVVDRDNTWKNSSSSKYANSLSLSNKIVIDKIDENDKVFNEDMANAMSESKKTAPKKVKAKKEWVRGLSAKTDKAQFYCGWPTHLWNENHETKECFSSRHLAEVFIAANKK